MGVMNLKDVFYGIFYYEKDCGDKYFIINMLFLFAKYHIHKWKFSDGKPYFQEFFNDLDNYMDLI